VRSSPHPPSPLLPHGEQGELPQTPLPDAVRSPSPAQGEGFGVRAPAKKPTPASSPLLPHGEQGEPPQIPLPDAVRSPSPAQGEGFGVRAPAKTLHLRGEGQGMRAFGALQGQKTAKHSNVLSAHERSGRGVWGEGRGRLQDVTSHPLCDRSAIANADCVTLSLPRCR
jgi:hypothetical protein